MPTTRLDRLGSASDGHAAHPDDHRHINVNGHQKHPFCSNFIQTAKYTAITFLPKFLFEQFRRLANVFFLAIGLLQQIPNVSPTGRFITIVPFSVILILTALKELLEDFKRHKDDRKINNLLISVLDGPTWTQKPWKQVAVGDVVQVENGKMFPADLLLLASSEPEGMCYIETANLDGETNLKIRSALPLTSKIVPPSTPALAAASHIHKFCGIIECEKPNRNLYEFKGNLKEVGGEFVPVPPSAVLLRGAKLMNTPYVIGVVIYTGHETKLLMNSTKAPLKRSNIDRITNYQIIFLFAILVFISLISAGANAILASESGDHAIYIGADPNANFFFNIITFFILYNNLIPISLQVTLEVVKFCQAFFINWDEKMYYAPSNTYALARTSNLNEELGQIKYIFSDKTGTLTCNIMEFKRCSVAGRVYTLFNEDPEDADTVDSLSAMALQLKGGDAETKSAIRHFLVIMSVCHTVIPEETDTGLFYNAASPDEKALVEGAAKYGFEFITRKPDAAIIRTPGGVTEEYAVLNVIEFTSTRKRMSVVVRAPDGRIRLYTKGADSIILERLGDQPGQSKYRELTSQHLETFAREGLRTLCLAYRDIEEDEYRRWNARYYAATTDISDARQDKIDAAAELLERDLSLLGATAIEDKLQDGVPETIAQLLEANIHLWVLTGDKQETAINIGYSCRLLREGMPIVILNTSSLDQTRDEITHHSSALQSNNRLGVENDMAMVVDGKSLTFALDHSLRKDFLELCCSCSVVICCRVSPIQKAEVVEMVQVATKSISLAIGDGANDVAMIQKADVGVGISGNEGLQAANSSDFAIAQFRFLARLLFVHGAWNYTRVSKVILYCFYKNICLYIIELWFAFYNFWSGQVLFERWTIGFYNIMFTSIPPIAIGLLDQYGTAETRMKYPTLYHSTQQSAFFNHKVFWIWMGVAVMHSAILFWLPMMTFGEGIAWASGRNGDYLVVGNTVYSFVVITVCLKGLLEMNSWSFLSHVSIWGSIGLWFVFLVIYSYFWQLGIPPNPANMVGAARMMFETPQFWLGLLLVPLTALLPDIIFKSLRVTIFTSETDRIRIAEAMKKDVGPYVPKSLRLLRMAPDTGSLMRNMRSVFSRTPSRPGGSAATEMELEVGRHGFAFSQEEGGAVSQAEFVRRYDTTARPTRSAAAQPGGGTYGDPFWQDPDSHDREHFVARIKSSLLSWRDRRSFATRVRSPDDAQISEETDFAGGDKRKSKKSGKGSKKSKKDKRGKDSSEENDQQSQTEGGSDSTKVTDVTLESASSPEFRPPRQHRVRAKHTELPRPVSPRHVVVVTKTKTEKSLAQSTEETKPLAQRGAAHAPASSSL